MTALSKMLKQTLSNALTLSKLAYGYLIFLMLIALLIPLAPSLNPNIFNPDLIGVPTPPSLHHPMGTDQLGRDLLLRSIYGARVSLSVSVIAVGISISIGTLLGILSGYIGGWFDEILMRLVDMMMALPTLFLILIVQSIFRPSLFNVMVVIGLTGWMGVARLVRAETLSVKERPFILAARARGISSGKILTRYVFPHTLNPILVTAALGMGGAILTESVLSFLGLGVQPPHASWGNMLQNSLVYSISAPWMVIIPGALITLTVLALNIIGDQLRSQLVKEETHAKSH